MDPEGHVEISGTVDPDLLLKMLGKSGKKAQLCWFQFGECSSNLFMSNRTANVAPGSYGRYIQNGNPPRPKLPSNEDHNQKHVDPNTLDQMQNFEHAHEHLHDHKPPRLAPRTKANTLGPGRLPPRAPPDTRDHLLNFEQAHKHLHDNKPSPASRMNEHTSGPSWLPPRAPTNTSDHMLTFEQAHKHLQHQKPLPASRTNATSKPGRLSAARAPPLISEGISCCNLM